MTTCVPDVPVQREANFLTVNPSKRRTDVLVRHIDDLNAIIKTEKGAHPLAILAMVVLPEHLHAIWRPPDDVDYPLCWSLIKAGFSQRLAKNGHIRASRQAKRERGIWQRRYWEHQIRDDGNQRIDNRYTDSYASCIYCVCIKRRIPCATPPSTYGHCPSNEI
ncbi:MAG: REP element-mobilizing transposase RayT [Candidatus Nitrotoga sp. CP45]|nr:MAG: REP element-mobilizing transposase RayT [Candidatus Nitrotoga sp. CP45]